MGIVRFQVRAVATKGGRLGGKGIILSRPVAENPLCQLPPRRSASASRPWVSDVTGFRNGSSDDGKPEARIPCSHSCDRPSLPGTLENLTSCRSPKVLNRTTGYEPLAHFARQFATFLTVLFHSRPCAKTRLSRRGCDVRNRAASAGSKLARHQTLPVQQACMT